MSTNSEKRKIILRRLRCLVCGAVHRELTDDVVPYKRYEREVIAGVIEELLTPYVLGYEDYPCEQTMARWLTQNLQLLLWKN